jgi:transposase
MGTKKHTYNNIQGRKGSQFREQLRGLNLEQVLFIPIDAAKFHQKAMVCNYFGDVIEESFFFSVNNEGINDFVNVMENAKKRMDAQRIFIGIEATGHYYEDIVYELGKRGYGVTIINAATTYEERSSALNWCKTDDLDLVAIAYALMQNKGMENKLPKGNHRQLLTLTRARRKEVVNRAKVRIDIRVQMDHIWREFQAYPVLENGRPKKKKIFSDFWGKSSVFFMENHPHPEDVLKLGEIGLRRISKNNKLRLRQETIEKLLYVAKRSLARPKEELRPELLILGMKIEELRQLDKHIACLEKEIEHTLLQTNGHLLLSVRGIGVVTAAEFYSELGDISQFENPNQLIKKAGTNPIVIQSGGGKGYFGKISKQGNKNLRFIVYTVGKSLVQHNQDLKPFFTRLKDKGKHPRKVYIAVGNKFIKIAFSMLRNNQPFRSKQEGYSILDEYKKKLQYTKIDQLLVA